MKDTSDTHSSHMPMLIKKGPKQAKQEDKERERDRERSRRELGVKRSFLQPKNRSQHGKKRSWLSNV